MKIETNAGMSPEFLRDQFSKMAREQKPIDYIIIGQSGAQVLMESLCSGKIRGYSTPDGLFKIEGITIKYSGQEPDVNLAVAVPPVLDFRYWPSVIKESAND
ncbi:MAG: hypothetical protein KDB65_13355 [Calditrichaeota bacterium]|nr:hypothetical protein [Calditrichota bacterium]